MAIFNDNMASSTATSSVAYCMYCGYSLVGSVSPRCPECGNRIPASKGITFLPWERIKDGNLPLRFARTLLDGTLHPRRMFRHLRERLETPIIRPKAFLGLAVGTSLAVSIAVSALETIAPMFWHTGSLVASCKEFWLLWFTLNYAPRPVFIVLPVVQLLCNVIVASWILRWAHRVSPPSTLGFESSCVALTLLFFPIFVIRTFLAFLEVFLLSLSLPGGLFTDGYLDHIMILAYGLVFFGVGVAGLEINRRRMLGAAIAFSFGSWVFLAITINLPATATLVLLGQK